MPDAKLPNFMIIGAAKGGTTSLASSLAAHPEVCMPLVKEPGFFAWHEDYARGLDKYMATHYSRCGGRMTRCDATPSYLCSPAAPDRIRCDLPSASHRFVVLLRDPVQRAWSHYWHMVRAGAEEETFEQAVAADDSRVAHEVDGVYNRAYLYGSRYGQHIARWRSTFSDGHFLFVLTDDLRANPGAVHGEVCRFIGVDPAVPLPVVNENRMARSRIGVVGRAVAAPAWVKRSWDLVLAPAQKQRLANALDRWDAAPFTPLAMDPELDRRLRADFDPDIAYVEALVERDLSAWRQPQP